MTPFLGLEQPRLERWLNVSHRYEKSGKKFSAYYTRICMRCGWVMRPPVDRSHDLAACDAILRTFQKPHEREHFANRIAAQLLSGGLR